MSDAPLLFRRATAADKDGILALCQAAMPDDWVPSVIDTWFAAADSGVYVGEQERRIVHCVHFDWPKPSEVFLAAMRVHPDLQGQGVGSWLAQRHVQEAWRQGAHTAFLLSVPGNRPAHRMIMKAGYVHLGRWVLWRGAGPPGIARDPAAARMATAADWPALAVYLKPQLAVGSATCLAGDGALWTLHSAALDDFRAMLERGDLFVRARGGRIEGAMAMRAHDRNGSRFLMVRHLSGSATAADDLLALAARTCAEEEIDSFVPSLPAAQAAHLDRHAFRPDLRWEACLFRCDLNRL